MSAQPTGGRAHGHGRARNPYRALLVRVLARHALKNACPCGCRGEATVPFGARVYCERTAALLRGTL